MTSKTEEDAQLQALKDFANSENREIVDNLDDILNDVAKTGQYIFPWHFMKPLYVQKLETVTTDFLNSHPPKNLDGTEDLEEINNLKNFREELIDSFGRFSLAPFTLQRVTELLISPKKHYKTTPKFFRGLEKNIMVVSTLEKAETEERNELKRQFENSNGKVEDMKPPIKRFTEGITYYSYGGPNATGASYKNISEDQDECDADVVGTDEQQINGFLANDHETTDNHGTPLSEDDLTSNECMEST